MADKHGAHQTDEAYVVSLCEDYCKSPSAPVGYMISQKLDMSTLVCSTVKGCGTPVLNMSSRIINVSGNEAGIGGGVVSGVNVGMCKPVENYAPTVKAEGMCLLRHDTIMEMNTAGPDGQGNVHGKIVYSSFHDGNKTSPKNRKYLKTVKLKDGLEVKVYEIDGPDSGYVFNKQSGKREIHLGRNRNPGAEANEMQHAMDDARDGSLNGILHDENMNQLSGLEAEIRSDQASIDELDRQQRERWDKCDGIARCTAELLIGGVVFWEARGGYKNRKAALERAKAKVDQGDLEGAREELKDYPSYEERVPEGPSIPSKEPVRSTGPTRPEDLRPWRLPPAI